MSIWNHLLCKRMITELHKKCRITDKPYAKSTVFRVPVPDDKVRWGVQYPEYRPPKYTDPSIYGKPYADEDIDDPKAEFKFNMIDGKIDRRSFIGQYSYDPCNMSPLNPMGRTGLRGRGLLGRWGPNHAADPIVTRVKDGVLQFVAIRRGDTGEWAIPGGMVDAGEEVSATLKREFVEEVLNSAPNHGEIDELWKHGRVLYKGYVDDPRNTDNAWMETVVMNFHDTTGLLEKVELQAGDDANAVRWVDAHTTEDLYASHSHFIKLLRDSHSEVKA